MARQPSVSVVVPVRDGASTLSACLDSVLPQLRDGDELVVVDDGSVDGCGEIAADRGVRVLRQSRLGPYAARNAGVAATHGEVILFIDPDCIALPGWVDALREACSSPGVSVALGLRRFPKGSRALRLLGAYEVEKDAFVLTGERERLYYGFTNDMAVRREAFEVFGGFADLPRGADTVLVQEALHAASVDAIAWCPDAAIVHTEVRSTRAYLRKVFLYGRHRRHADGRVRARALGPVERLTVLRCVTGRSDVGVADGVLLAVLLGAGAGAWWAGSLSSRLRLRVPSVRPGKA
jgi:glycosyltransferase involved in cell wall biosynthesis